MNPELLKITANLLIDKILKKGRKPDAIGGLTLGADPLVSALALKASQVDRQLDALIVRKEAKGHGTGAWIEGPLPPLGSLVTVLEDVVTTGGSSFKAVKKIREADFHRVFNLIF